MTIKKCSVTKCKGLYESWIDIFDDMEKIQNPRDRLHGRFPFCQKHFDIIFPYVQKKEKEMQEKDNKHWFWAWVPLSVVNEALKLSK